MARRSVLFSPGDRPDLLRNALDSGADAVVFDLEDAVVPAKKAEARAAVREVLEEMGRADATNAADTADAADTAEAASDRPEICVRVRPPGLGAAGDLKAVLGGANGDRDADAGAAGPDALVLPKADGAPVVTELAALAAEHGGDLPVLALVETAAGVLHAEEIAAAGPTDALIFGAEDLAADVGATRTSEGTEVLHAREHVLLAARAAGVDAVDTVFTDFEDEAGLREAAAFARQLGYDGKLAIHPAQVGPIHEAFTPGPERVAWAERVLDARDEADEAGRGVFAVDGEMVDAPLVAQAERVLERARSRRE